MAQEGRPRGAPAFMSWGAGLAADKPAYKACRPACNVPVEPPWGIGRPLNWACAAGSGLPDWAPRFWSRASGLGVGGRLRLLLRGVPSVKGSVGPRGR